MATGMKVLGVSTEAGKVWIKCRKGDAWKGATLSVKEFAKMAKETFPRHCSEYKGDSMTGLANFFCQYGRNNPWDEYIFTERTE